MAVLNLDSLPLGFRFRPTDAELIDFYLRLKINGKDNQVRVIREIDVCKWEPWDLPGLSAIKTQDPEWFFFNPLDRKYPNGSRQNRATEAGYWKATGKDRTIKLGKNLIGMKKTLVFYSGRAPKGKRTNWVMHEYRTTLDELDGTKPGQAAFVLLRLFKKDEIIEGSNSDVVDPADLSPIPTNLSSEEVQSEVEMALASSSLEEEVEKNPAIVDSCLNGSSMKTTSDTVSPIQFNNYDAYNAEGEHCATPTEVDWLLEEDLNKFYDPSLEPLPLDSKLFSPLHTQLQVEMGSCMQYPIDNSCSGLEFQYGTSNYDSSFLNSVLNNSDQQCGDECGCWMNSTVESEAANGMNFSDVTQGSFEPELWSNKESVFETLPRDYPPLIPEQSICSAATDQPYNLPKSYEHSIDNATSGIRLKARPPRNQMEMDKFITQGDAPKRIRLQCEMRRVLRKTSTVLLLKDEDYYVSEPIITKDDKVVEEDNSVAGSGITYCTSIAGSREISLSESTEKSSLTSESSVPAQKHKDITFQFSAAAASPQKNRPFRVLFRIAVILVLFSVSVSMRIVL